MGACGNLGGGCGACSAAGELPGGKLPTDQTIEGGAQVRVTPAGFDKLTQVMPGLVNQGLGGGFCVPKGKIGDPTGFLGTGAQWCYKNQTSCTPGCKANVSINPGTFHVSVSNNQTMNIALSTSVSASIPLSGQVIGIGASCTLSGTSNDLHGDFDIKFGVRNDNGELDIHLDHVNAFQLNMDFSGCSLLSDIANIAGDIIDSFAGQFVIQLLSPLIDNLLQKFIPSPLGMEGMMDIGALLQGVSPGTKGEMEARIVPGGYADLVNGGMNMGIITGLNSDEDPRPESRTPELDSEPALCVPPMAAPVFTLPTVGRSALGGSTFTLAPADAFAGTADPDSDIAMGISLTTLNLTGHHLVTSGGMCLGVGTPLIKQLNVGTLGILVPSLADLQSDKGNDPLLLVTRPQKAIDFSIGNGTSDQDPNLTIHIRNMEVDFYGFLFERYTRAFTMDLTMDVGINMTFEMQGSQTVIKPQLVGISSSEVTVHVLNSEFVRESAQQLESTLPSVFDLVTPLLGNLPDIPVPSFAGFALNPTKLSKVVTSQDQFLALYANMSPGPAMRTASQRDKFGSEVIAKLDAALPHEQRADGRSKLLSVDTPEPQLVIDELMKKDGALPSVTFEVDRRDTLGRELEWSWNLNGGLWRPYSSASPLVISDRAFAWQGRYQIGLKSRVKGDYHTTSDATTTDVVIDSVGPRIFSEKASTENGELTVPVWDIVYGKDVEVAFGAVGDDEPTTKWMPADEASLASATATKLGKDHGGEILAFARDASGNQTVAIIAPFHGQAGSSGCACQTGGAPGSGSLVLFGLVGLGILRPRRRKALLRGVARALKHRAVRTVAMFVGMVTVSSFMPGCSCSKNEGKSCETAADCGMDFCGEGEIPFCIDNTCVCSDDIVPGRIGPYSDVASGYGATWVSAYASTRGDLVVAQATGGRVPTASWEWVDGVPDGPVLVPDSKIRNGIDDAGSDVGMYSSISLAKDGTPMVSYFDKDTASLKFAARVGGVWTNHIVQQGTSQIDNAGGSLIGMYTSMTVRSDDGRPGIAYLAHVADSTGQEHAEVRYAQATTQFPSSTADWKFYTLDTAAIPDTTDDVYPLPGGLGLFIDSARNPMDNAPAVVYYDRAAGELKIARFNAAMDKFNDAVVLDGSDGVDAGWSPTVTIDQNGVANIAYVNATGDDLRYITDAKTPTKELIDDGYRIVGTTVDGLPKPEFHFVGDDATIVVPVGGQPMVTYQDATTHELLLATRKADGTWNRESIAGAAQPFAGAYGFFASSVLDSGNLVMSSWVIDQPDDDNWVEVFTKQVTIL